MLDRAILERDRQYLDAFVASETFQALRQDLPAILLPGLLVVDFDRFLAALRADCGAALAVPAESWSPVLRLTASVAHRLSDALRELVDARASEEAGWQALAQVDAEAA